MEDEIRSFEKAIVKDVEDQQDRVEREVKGRQAKMVQVLDEGLHTLAPHEHRRKDGGDV